MLDGEPEAYRRAREPAAPRPSAARPSPVQVKHFSAPGGNVPVSGPISGALGCPASSSRVAWWPMHFVVVGCGRVGSGMAIRVTEHGHSVAIIDKNPRAFRRLPREWPGIKVVGSGFDRDALDAAGAPKASALAAVTSGTTRTSSRHG